jgi:acyl-CoA ligase (AMP-forming) (exosortase A-associated)
MKLLHDLIEASATSRPDQVALYAGAERTTYRQLADLVASVGRGLANTGLRRGDRVAIYLPKCVPAVAAMFGASAAGAVFVPINPILKSAQVAHILRDSGARVLITSATRVAGLAAGLVECPDVECVVSIDTALDALAGAFKAMVWNEFLSSDTHLLPRGIDADIAAILYTSGSTGKPKGVVLSHRNMVCGAESVAQYLRNTPDDRILAVLPFSFDYGFSQLSTAFLVGAGVALMEYLVPRDIVSALSRYEITGLAAVPPLWIQLAPLDWPDAVVRRLRYITNSGGAMPTTTLKKLREKLSSTSVFLMYGLTEAFRSTYLDPSQVDIRPTSIGKAIPNAEILVVRPDGTLCDAGEPGELVHRGAHVSLGYWNDVAQTAARFKPAPARPGQLAISDLAVWSGDTVTRDEEGYLYFVGRRDEMIKTSGYRVSPTEVEEVVYATGLVAEAVVVGAPHAVLGKAIVVIGVPRERSETITEKLLAACRDALPTYMVPLRIAWRDELPRNANGKLDRPALAAEVAGFFAEADRD